MSANSSELIDQLIQQLPLWSTDLGFVGVAVSRAQIADDDRLMQQWLSEGLHGEMDYLERNQALRRHPEKLQNGTRSVISARMPYWPDAADAKQVLKDDQKAYISRYSLGRDYHKLMRQRLSKLALKIAEFIGPHGYRAFADSAPVLEKALARDASLGWIGKHTLLIDEKIGSYFFIGEIYTDLALPASDAPPAQDRCGNCQACIRACPTQAIIGPQKLDARRCISYLTIENKGAIPTEFRQAMGNRIFGCDDCQIFCPWNRHAQVTALPDFQPRHGLDCAQLLTLFAWTEEEFLKRTEGMPIRRTGYIGWQRNLSIALGNASYDVGIENALDIALKRAHVQANAMLQEHVNWALQQQQAKKIRA